jgi:large subunit ribosomal protein L11
MKGDVIPVEITIFQDKSFTFELKSPPAAALIKKAAGIPKGASESGVNIVGKITLAQAKEIGKTKMQDLNAMDEDSAAKIIAGTARSMGIEVIN